MQLWVLRKPLTSYAFPIGVFGASPSICPSHCTYLPCADSSMRTTFAMVGKWPWVAGNFWPARRRKPQGRRQARLVVERTNHVAASMIGYAKGSNKDTASNGAPPSYVAEPLKDVIGPTHVPSQSRQVAITAVGAPPIRLAHQGCLFLQRRHVAFQSTSEVHVSHSP